ncbi:unnamed protein product, partial [Brenthis ino]
MPPFKAGLLKRKLDSGKEKDNVPKEDSNDSDNVEDLMKGDIDNGSDATDSEHEGDNASDGERDVSSV